MSGRIRTLKPEWLEDELLSSASSDARVLSVALLLLADDYGNGRASLAEIASKVWGHRLAVNDGADAPAALDAARVALSELVAVRFVSTYQVAGQSYFAIRNWKKHQRVDKPGKPRVPGPSDQSAPKPGARVTERTGYFIRGATTGLIKVGSSADPVARLADLARAGSEPLELLAIGGDELEHHRQLAADRVHGEWFRASPDVLAKIREYGGDPDRPIATAGYSQGKRTVEVAPRESSRPSQDFLAPDPDLRPPTSTSDPDPDRGPPPKSHASLAEKAWTQAVTANGGRFAPHPVTDGPILRTIAELIDEGRGETPLLEALIVNAKAHLAQRTSGRSSPDEWLKWAQRQASQGKAAPKKARPEDRPATSYENDEGEHERARQRLVERGRREAGSSMPVQLGEAGAALLTSLGLKPPTEAA